MRKIIFVILMFFAANYVLAAHRTINLIVGYKTVNFAGKLRYAIAVNNQIPAPTLHFKQGDHVTINVYNALKEETAIHWHGMLIPWQMDGVLGVSQQGIQPGQWFRYDFSLHQTGTYWYHAHAGLQEQQGLYGAFLVDPIKQSPYSYNKEYVVVLSDWSNTYPDQILANLKKEGDYYSPRFPLQPSLLKFIKDYRKADIEERKKLIADYKMMQTMRMSIYDISDVAFDAFLLNGQNKQHLWRGLVKPGDVVRLRFIGAAGSSIFHVKIPGSMMQMVHVQGNDVVPYQISDFRISPGETYDVLVKINKNEPYIIYAESEDKVGAAYGALVTQPNQIVSINQVKPFPEPLPVTREMMDNMKSNHSSHSSNDVKTTMQNEHVHHNSQKTQTQAEATNSEHNATEHAMQTEPTIIGDSIISDEKLLQLKTNPNTKYQHLIAALPTNDVKMPIAGIIRMELFGYMDRFIWFINGLPEYKAKPIVLEPGKRYRLIFTNTSMMHHPMHLHGHWFILRKGLGTYDPLLHTLDVPPGATMVADFDTDASGQWFFHCHLLYHMLSGMARVFQYSTVLEIVKNEAHAQNIIQQTKYHNRPIVRVDTTPIDKHLINHPMAHPINIYGANFLEFGIQPGQALYQISYKGLYGFDYDKLELQSKDAEINKNEIENADIDIFYWRLISQFWAIKGGVNYFYEPSITPYWQIGFGLEGTLPYFIETDLRTYFYRQTFKLDAELLRDTQLTNNFFIKLGIRSILATKTEPNALIGQGLNQMRFIIQPFYRLAPGWDAFLEYEHEQNYGVYKKLQLARGDAAQDDTLTIGLSTLF